MAMNLEAVLKIAAKVTGLQDLGALEKGLIGAERAAGAAKGGFKAMIDSSAWQGAAVAAAGIGVALGGSVKAAIDFESAMADVRKVVPGLESAEGFKAMSREIVGMSRELPVSAKGLAEIMAAAGQAGIAKEELADFTRQAAQMGIAFDISAGEAGEAMAKLRTSLGLSQPQVVDLADAMNYLSNNMASSAAEVTQFMLRSGAMGKQVKMTVEQTAAFGSAMIAAGAAPEVAATSFNNLIKAMSKGESATANQSAAFKSLGLDVMDVAKSMQVDAVGTIRDVFERISKMPAEMRVSTISQIFGDEARALTPLITNMKLFDQAMGLVGDKSKYTGSMLAEFQTRSGTSANQFQILRNNVEALAIAIGNGLLPAINGMLFVLTPVIAFISDIAGRFPILTGAVTLLAAAFVGLVAIAPFVSSFITLLGALSALKIGATIAGWAAALLPLKAAFAGLLAFLTGTLLPGLLAIFSGPVGWTVLAVAAVVAMVALFRKPIGQFFTWLGGAISTAFSGLMGLLQPIFVQPFIKLWNNVLRKPVTTMIGWLQTTWKGITKFFGDSVVTPISKAWTALNELLPNAMKKTGEFVQSVWTGIINNIKNVMRGMLNFVVSGINTAVNAINYLIDGYNRIPVVADIPRLGFLSVPAFAEGGIVDRPTLAMVGEGGEREYIIPQSKMAAASANFLSGARGGAVIPQSSGGGGGGNAQISITTGPVLQQGGEQYVTLYDLERAMQMTADGVYKSLRTSSGRYATGVR
jgi:TP901 family phage tail tape measure protein